jgi:hypothetical protein
MGVAFLSPSPAVAHGLYRGGARQLTDIAACRVDHRPGGLDLRVINRRRRVPL